MPWREQHLTALETVLAQHGTSSESQNYSAQTSQKSQLTEAARQRASLPLPSAANLGVTVYAAQATEKELGDENKTNKSFFKKLENGCLSPRSNRELFRIHKKLRKEVEIVKNGEGKFNSPSRAMKNNKE